MYNGQISAVIHAVDIRSGTTVALKLYKRSKLTDVERRQVGFHMGWRCYKAFRRTLLRGDMGGFWFRVQGMGSGEGPRGGPDEG